LIQVAAPACHFQLASDAAYSRRADITGDANQRVGIFSEPNEIVTAGMRAHLDKVLADMLKEQAAG
jgi:hypothetical protein